MSPTISPQQFVNKWRAVEQKERSTAQSHFNDLCDLIEQGKPLDVDPTGASFAFEVGANKTTGGDGFADVWKRNHFAWEYKGKHANLDKAYQQLLQYHESLGQPPLLVVCDIDTIIVHTKFTNTVKHEIRISLDDLLTPKGMRELRAIFTDPEYFRAEQTTEQVTQTAAVKFAELAEHLRGQGAEAENDPEAIAHFLIRLLFCLFAEDIDLLPNKLFTRLIMLNRSNPTRFGTMLGDLFGAMASGGAFGVEPIRHFNGGLFDDDGVLALDYAGLRILQEIAALDWGSIEPSILGTLFERSLDPSKRSQLGAHYTSREDILLLVEPVLMAPLRREWAEAKAMIEAEVTKRDSEIAAWQARTDRTATAKSQQIQALRTRSDSRINSLIQPFLNNIRTIRVLDPACGSGNFLYMSLRQLLDLEKEVISTGAQAGIPALFPEVNPAQLFGIELNEYAHELAQATVWIGWIQWLHENGYGVPSEPILKRLDNIKQMDAILAFDGDGKPIEPVWPEAEVIIGNPPFLGSNRLRWNLGDEYVNSLFSLYKGAVPGQADMVCYWFELARKLIIEKRTKRAGLLATNSIRHSANREVLDRILESGGIFWALSDKQWVLDGAQVRISMIGFDSGEESEKSLDGNNVEHINANLTALADITKAKVLTDTQNLSFVGIEKAGAFDISQKLAQEMINSPINPNGCKNLEVVKPCENAIDLAERSKNVWIVDFGEMSLEDAAQFELPFEYIRTNVKPERDTNREESRRNYWWIFGRPRPAMREAIAGLNRFIVTPRVSKHRFFLWRSHPIVPLNKVIVIARDDDYIFGVLSSRFHEVWSIKSSSRHGVGNDIAYNNSICFETFPLPWLIGQEPTDAPRVQAIAQAAQELNAKRENWLNPPDISEAELKKRTLTNLYNARPTWLDLAHRKLDHAVAAAYGWPADLADEEILARLLALNLERASR